MSDLRVFTEGRLSFQSERTRDLRMCVCDEIKVLGKGVEREFWGIFKRERQKRHRF